MWSVWVFCLWYALPSRRFLPSTLSSGPSSHTGIPGGHRTQVGGSFCSVWGWAGSGKDLGKTLLRNRKPEEFGMVRPHWTVKKVGVQSPPPTVHSLTGRQVSPWGCEEPGLQPGRPNLPERAGGTGHSGTGGRRTLTSAPLLLPVCGHGDGDGDGDDDSSADGARPHPRVPHPCPVGLRRAQAAETSLRAESCDSGPARGTHGPLWGQEGSRHGRPAQLLASDGRLLRVCSLSSRSQAGEVPLPPAAGERPCPFPGVLQPGPQWFQQTPASDQVPHFPKPP